MDENRCVSERSHKAVKMNFNVQLKTNEIPNSCRYHYVGFQHLDENDGYLNDKNSSMKATKEMI